MTLLPEQIILWMAAISFIAGVITLMGGILILVFKVSGRDIRSLSNQTAQMAQKGLTEGLAGIIENAATLMDSMNQLIRTTAGIGVFLCCLGLTLMVAACLLIFFLQRGVA
jgi:hypothetical protein